MKVEALDLDSLSDSLERILSRPPINTSGGDA